MIKDVYRQSIFFFFYSNVGYKFSCGRCNAIYYGRTCRYLTGKKLKSKKSMAVKDRMFFCDHIVSVDDFKILATSYSDFHAKVKESLLISRDEPFLNKNGTSLPLYLFE